MITTTHTCLKFLLIFAQCFGLLPVCGVQGQDYKSLKFKWTAKRTLYSLIFFMLAFLNTILQLMKIIRSGITEFGQIVTLLFFAVTATTVLIFIDVARKWPLLMKQWSEVDQALSGVYKFPFNLHKNLRFVAGITMLGAIIEHALCIGFMVQNASTGEDLSHSIQLYYEDGFQHIFQVVPYCFPLGIIAQIFNAFSTVSWNFMDLFIMLISLTLSARFKQITQLLEALTYKKEKSICVWRCIRQNYTKLINLCLFVDNSISTIILVSFANNIFVILVQFYFSLKGQPSRGTLDKIYFIYSFSFLICRTIAVIVCAGTINSENRKIKNCVNFLREDGCNSEMERFINHVRNVDVALTGHGLFRVTNSLLLSIAGSVVSYELVLVQLVH